MSSVWCIYILHDFDSLSASNPGPADFTWGCPRWAVRCLRWHSDFRLDWHWPRWPPPRRRSHHCGCCSPWSRWWWWPRPPWWLSSCSDCRTAPPRWCAYCWPSWCSSGRSPPRSTACRSPDQWPPHPRDNAPSRRWLQPWAASADSSDPRHCAWHKVVWG